ncbi:MAG: MFS transporter [Candidatus Nanohalobium sp.]
MDLDSVPRIAKYLSTVFLLVWIGRSTVWMFLPVFFRRNIESVFLIGVMTSLPSIIPAILDIPVGKLVQKAGEKSVVFAGLITTAIPALLYITAAPVLLVAGKAVEGVAKSLIWNGGWSLSLKSSDPEVESESVSVFLLGTNTGIVVGPILGGLILKAYGFTIPFIFWIFSALLAVAVFYAYIGLDLEQGITRSVEELMNRRTYMDEVEDFRQYYSVLMYPFALTFLYSIIFSFYWLTIPLLLEKVNAGFPLMGVIFGVAALPKLFQFVFGDLADRFGHSKILAGLALCLTPVLLAMSRLEGALMLGVFFFIARIFSAGMSPAIHAEFDARTPEEVEGEMTGFLEFFKHSGQSIGPILAGTAASIWSLQASFIAAAAVAAVIFLTALTNTETFSKLF